MCYFFLDRFEARSEPVAYREAGKCAYQVRSCDRSVSVVAGARISILSSDRISPAPANYTRQLAERSSWPLGRPIGRPAGSLELTLNLYVFLHTFRYRHDILLTTPRFEDLIYASRYFCPLCVRRACAGRPFTPAVKRQAPRWL